MGDRNSFLKEKKSERVKDKRDKNKFFNNLKNQSNRLFLDNNHTLNLKIRFLHIGWQSLSFVRLPKHRNIKGVLVCFSRLLPKEEVERRILEAFKDFME